MLSPVRQYRLPGPQSFFSFNSCPAECTVEDVYNGPAETPIKILLTSCKDLIVALQNLPVCASQKVESIDVIFPTKTLLARNVLYLNFLCDEAFNPANQDDISYFWNVWYDMKWSEKTRIRFLEDVDYLCGGNLPEKTTICQDNKEQLIGIWKKWFEMASEKSDTKVVENTEQQRYRAIAQYFQKCIERENSSIDIGGNLEQLWDWMWTQTKAQEDLKYFPTDCGNAVINEMKSHFLTGNSQGDAEVSCLNPMFLDTENATWSLSPKVSAFESFGLERHEPAKDDIMSPYLRAFSERVQEERKQLKNTTFHLSHGNFFDFCYRLLFKKFDVVDFTGSSNQTDHLGLANILNASSLIVSSNPHAILITESSSWLKHDNSQYETIREFVEGSIGTNIALIPSLFGFTLRNHLLLGNPLPLAGSHRATVKLRWRKSPHYANAKVRLLSAAQSFIPGFRDACFYRSTENLDTKNFFTPFSYAFFVSSLTSRISLEDVERTELHDPEVPPNYELAWKTVKAWMSGEDVVCVEACFKLTQNEKGSLKVVMSGENLPVEQYFENFSMIREGDAFRISFLLLKEHSLADDSTTLFLSRGARTVQISDSSTLKEAIFSDFNVPFPFIKQKDVPDRFSCDETEKSYCIYLKGISQENLGVSTDLSHLSEASHEIRISGPDFDENVSFPWPFKISEVHSLGEPEDEPLRLILPKAIFEPHPFEWDHLPKWSFESLSVWSNETVAKDLNFHLSAQFQFSDLKRQIMDLPEADHLSGGGLRGVREVIRTIFQSAVLDGQCWFVIESKHDPRMKSLWFLRVHLPVRVSPWGSPMLFMTANDHRLAQKLVDRGILEQSKATEDFKHFFVGGANSSAVASIYIQSEEEENMLRYLLRLNSIRVDRYSWPIENLPSGKQSPWLTTFITPSYIDFAGTNEEMSDLLELTNNLAIVSKEARAFKELKVEPVEFCTKCSKIGDLKRCSRCKSVKYCSTDCQKSDWATHKAICAQIVASFMP